MKKSIFSCVIIVVLMVFLAVGSVFAGDAASYQKMDFGYNGCKVQFGELKSGVSEGDMIGFAAKAGAEGFTYHPSLKYGKLITGKYPNECKSPANQSWPLYLKKVSPVPPAPPTISYQKMDFGFNGCKVQFGEMKKGVSEGDMIGFAAKAGAEGFTYHPSLKNGKIIIGKYPNGCKSPVNQSWPLYLKIN